MSDLATKYKGDGLVVLALNAWDEERDVILRYSNENKLAQKMLLNGSKVKEDYGVKYVPTVFWIDREGYVRSMAMGESTVADLEKRTQAILGKKG